MFSFLVIEWTLSTLREHAEEDDKRLEEQVQGVVDGEMRKKKRGGLGLDGDSDDDDDDDYSAREARRKMKEVRPRSDIEGLGSYFSRVDGFAFELTWAY
jgi:mediator of replication checkpoint protein 1